MRRVRLRLPRRTCRSSASTLYWTKRSGGSVGVGPGAAAAAEGVDLGMRSAVSAGIDADKRARQLEAKGEGKGEGADAGLDDFSLRMAREVLTDLLLLSRARLLSGMMSSVLYRAAAAMAISQGRLISPPVAVDADWWRLPGQVNTEPFVPLPVAVPGEQVPYIIPPTPTRT